MPSSCIPDLIFFKRNKCCSQKALALPTYEASFCGACFVVLNHLALCTGAGADFVMLGGMLAGHDQSGGEIIERGGKKLKLFYGMSSSTAMNKHAGGVAEYR